MTHVNFDTSSRTGQDDTTIFGVLRKIVAKNPNAGEDKIKRLYREAIKDDPDLTDTFISTFYENVRARAFPPKPEKRKRKTKAQVEEQTRKQLSRGIFNFIMPSGKKLKDCSFGEVATFGERWSKLSTMGKYDEIVGQVLKQKEARKVLLG
jgi:hypothetical protein